MLVYGYRSVCWVLWVRSVCWVSWVRSACGLWLVMACGLWPVMCWLWPVMGVVDDRCWRGFVVVIIILFYFNLSRGRLVVVAAVGGGWLWLGWLCWWSWLGLLGLCLADFRLLGSMVELACWEWRGKWKWEEVGKREVRRGKIFSKKFGENWNGTEL